MKKDFNIAFRVVGFIATIFVIFIFKVNLAFSDNLRTCLSSIAYSDFSGSYCEMDGAYTDSGKAVYGEFYMYSDKYGEADGAYIEDGIAVYVECYRYVL